MLTAALVAFGHFVAFFALAAALALLELDGRALDTSAMKGRVAVLDFWATWCMPCRAEMPGMETLWQNYKEQGLVIAAVSVDEGSRGRIETFSKLFDLSFPILLDPESKVSDLYKVSNMPTSFLIDRNGKIVSRIVGTEEWTSPEAIQLVEKLLAQ